MAPIELAMWIPALLLIAALMLNFGTVVVWRTRGEIASRDVVWRARWSHDASSEATLRPTWPVDAKLRVAGGAPVIQLDDPALQHPVTRGPLPNGFNVRGTLNPLRGVIHGEAAVTRNFPMLARRLGSYSTGDIRHTLLDQLWPCRETGNYSNVARRIPALYQLPTTDASLPQAFVNADTAILSIPHFNDLSVLDRDEEVFRYRRYHPDFHPRISTICELDPAVIQRSQVNRLVIHTDSRGRKQLGEVTLLPRRMTSFYLSMYNAEVNRLRADIRRMQQEQRNLPGQIDNAGTQAAQAMNQIAMLQATLAALPPDSPDIALLDGQIQSLQAQAAAWQQSQAQMQERLESIPGLIAANEAAIAEILPKIEQLEAFQQRISGFERMVLAR